MKDQKEVVYGGPKYKSQLKIFERMIVVFDKAIKERELLLNNQISHENKEKIIEMFDEKFFRMWEFYLAGCEMAFKWGDQVVYQFQLTKNYTSTPVTRDYIYQ